MDSTGAGNNSVSGVWVCEDESEPSGLIKDEELLSSRLSNFLRSWLYHTNSQTEMKLRQHSSKFGGPQAYHNRVS
jgi:hypothetical protein